MLYFQVMQWSSREEDETWIRESLELSYSHPRLRQRLREAYGVSSDEELIKKFVGFLDWVKRNHDAILRLEEDEWERIIQRRPSEA